MWSALTSSWGGYQRVTPFFPSELMGRMKDKDYSQVATEKFIVSWQDLTKLSTPIIAAVNGYAVSLPPRCIG